MTKLILYDRPGCHLCEQAFALIESMGQGQACDSVDIEQDIQLLRRYGLRIPVLQRKDTGAELDWPFDSTRLAQFLQD